MLAIKAKVERARMSRIENGYLQPNPEELGRIEAALTALIKAKQAVQQTAEEVGWPLEAL
jgi:hypothetical protein